MNYVREEDIKKILELSEMKVETVFDKCTNVLVKLPNGFVLSASSGAVDIENYNERLGVEYCMKKIEDELWKLEGYALAKRLYKEKQKKEFRARLTSVEEFKCEYLGEWIGGNK